MRIGEAAAYLNMSVVGVRKAASEGRLPSRRTGSGQRVVDRQDLDVYLGRPTPESVPAPAGWKRCTAGCPARPVRIQARQLGKDAACECHRHRVPGQPRIVVQVCGRPEQD
ncbi:possible DNA-binding protein [Rhodococcus jostii RHA1]|uniref:Possible DNA-binding protein n=1 Tax=Rhodococcus jostii (strain RHA1) TaxID=101510 RepID=Q0S5P7_RHOJR|nr:helix-turn-helix domain-containing protein [Rhodococcus jostii]ABG97139.1 possible DNA-binding protein [Rhodococcus jostii RHA1]